MGQESSAKLCLCDHAFFSQTFEQELCFLKDLKWLFQSFNNNHWKIIKS